jgi:Zn-dependent alcohol dehydrogenase
VKVRGAVLREMGLEPPYASSRPLEVVELELAPPGPGEMLVRVRAAGLCHSDLSVIDGSRPRVMPMVLGHEGAGEVVELGPDVEGFSVGDHVVTTFVPACGHCEPCRDGRAPLCVPGAAANTAGTLLGGERRWGEDGGDELHHHLGISAFGAAANAANVRMGDRVAIFGLGGVGLAALLGARAAGATTIVASDRVQSKLDLALELGATHTVMAGPAAVEEVRAATGGGADAVIETVGNAAVLAEAYAATRRGGVTVTVGLPHPSQELKIPAVSLVAEERTLRGSYLGSGVPALDVPRYIDAYKAGKLPVDRLLTHRIALDELNEGFDRLASGEAVRQAVVFD